jgi:hypothetical protein
MRALFTGRGTKSKCVERMSTKSKNFVDSKVNNNKSTIPKEKIIIKKKNHWNFLTSPA